MSHNENAVAFGRTATRRVIWGCLLSAAMALTVGCGGGGSGGTDVSGSGIDVDENKTAIGGASTSLSWATPTEREDGSALAPTEIVGFEIVYGPISNPAAETVQVTDPTASSYTLAGLSPGSYVFSLRAVDQEGRRSALSNTLTKTVN